MHAVHLCSRMSGVASCATDTAHGGLCLQAQQLKQSGSREDITVVMCKHSLRMKAERVQLHSNIVRCLTGC